LEQLASQRLTAAMVGLLRSFTVNTFDPSDRPGQEMCAMINQNGVATEVLVRSLLDELAEIRAGLRQELSVGLGQVAEELENRGRLFECGWSWGVVDGAPEVPYASDIGHQPTACHAVPGYRLHECDSSPLPQFNPSVVIGPCSASYGASGSEKTCTTTPRNVSRLAQDRPGEVP
jgi:hypothetical protein